MNCDLDKAHHFANNNKPALERDHICGCFYCISIFSPQERIIDDNSCDKYGTAICPHCDTDSVLGGKLWISNYARFFAGDATSMV